MKKVLLILLLLVGFTATGFAQKSEKLVEVATKKVDFLNKQITSVDKSLALTKEQFAKITELQVTRLKEVKVLKKAKAEKDAIKAVNKKYNQKIFKNVLTKEQMKARKEAKDKAKA